jgi:serine/threonine-protein kinase
MYCPHCGVQNDEGYKFCKTCGADLSATIPLSAAKEEPQEPSEVDLVRGELAEEYEILEELGRGGMAIVFRAKEKLLDREVAIKVLPFSLAFDKDFVERFQREARTSAKLEHPNIIPIYRVGKSGRVIYFVMKFLRGKPLSALLAARGALPPQEIRQVLGQMGRALAYAHRSGIVHRDIKPDNIMFDEHGQALVTDFGIAKAATGGKLTGTGMAIGTPHYMSPEQARAQSLDGRSDIYSLGVVAYQCLTGVVPFDGEDSFSIGYKHIMEELPTPTLETQEQRELFEVVKKMMAKLPAERFQTADEMFEVLESGAGFVATGISSAQTRSIPSVGFPKLSVSTAATTPLPRLSTGLPPVPVTKGRSTAAGLLIWVLAVGGIVGGGGYFAYKKGLIFHGGAAADSTTAGGDSTQLALGDSLHAGDSPSGGDSARGVSFPAGTPGRLVLSGTIPREARVTMDGQAVRGTQLDLVPGTHKLEVHATGYVPYEKQVLIRPGTTNTLAIELRKTTVVSGGAGGAGAAASPTHSAAGYCDRYGPDYNQDNMCFDTKPIPLQPTFVPIPAEATETPRPAILLIQVSSDGLTLAVREFVGSNVVTFTNQAIDMAKTLRWQPAQKNGDPVDAWVQYQFLPRRQ